MSIVSNMQITVKPGMRAEAIEAFLKRRVFDECAEAIPGFLGAQLLEAQAAPDALAVIAEWRSEADFQDWVAHPVRARQEADLAHFLAGAPQTALFWRRDAGYGA